MLDKTEDAWQKGFRCGVQKAMELFDEEMNETGDVRNARQAMKTLLRFGPEK